MSKIIDLKGQRFGHLLVIEQDGRALHNNEVTWRCRCDCGNYITLDSSDLRRNYKNRRCRACTYKHRRKENAQ